MAREVLLNGIRMLEEMHADEAACGWGKTLWSGRANGPLDIQLCFQFLATHIKNLII